MASPATSIVNAPASATAVHDFVYNNLLTAVFLVLGAGAIAQVVYEVGRLLARQSAEDGTPLLTRATLGGLVAGIVIRYATVLLVTAWHAGSEGKR